MKLMKLITRWLSWFSKELISLLSRQQTTKSCRQSSKTKLTYYSSCLTTMFFVSNFRYYNFCSNSTKSLTNCKRLLSMARNPLLLIDFTEHFMKLFSRSVMLRRRKWINSSALSLKRCVQTKVLTELWHLWDGFYKWPSPMKQTSRVLVCLWSTRSSGLDQMSNSVSSSTNKTKSPRNPNPTQ